jgi:hypothetical protein
MPHPVADQRTTDRTHSNRAESARNPIERLHRFLDTLAGSDFYGKVTVSFQNGKVHDIKIEQTKKLEEL